MCAARHKSRGLVGDVQAAAEGVTSANFLLLCVLLWLVAGLWPGPGRWAYKGGVVLALARDAVVGAALRSVGAWFRRS